MKCKGLDGVVVLLWSAHVGRGCLTGTAIAYGNGRKRET